MLSTLDCAAECSVSPGYVADRRCNPAARFEVGNVDTFPVSTKFPTLWLAPAIESKNVTEPVAGLATSVAVNAPVP